MNSVPSLPRMKTKIAPVCFIGLLAVGLCSAQTPRVHARVKDVDQICAAATAKPLVEPKLSGPLTAKELAGCDESELYYGFHGKPNYAAALQCGWYQRAHPQSSVGNMFYGPGVLTMLYANGRGVAQDINLAIRFACENGWAAEAEMEYRIGHLEALQKGEASGKTFDLCDDITSGLSDGACTSIQTSRRDAVRDAEVKQIRLGLAPEARKEFPALATAETKFEGARTGNEVDLSGTSRAAFQLEEQAVLRDQFLINLQRLGKGDIPAANDAELARLDGELNRVYLETQHAPTGTWEFGTVKPEGIRATERAWVVLADEWVRFAQVAYPHLTATRVRAQMIRLRLHQLRSLNPE